jgi:hypothetical protein
MKTKHIISAASLVSLTILTQTAMAEVNPLQSESCIDSTHEGIENRPNFASPDSIFSSNCENLDHSTSSDNDIFSHYLSSLGVAIPEQGEFNPLLAANKGRLP